MRNLKIARRTSAGPVPSQESHDAILDAAEAILKENGTAAGFTMEAVAKRARAGKPTLYRRWKSKGELFLELVETRIVPGLPTVDEIPETGSLGEQLADYMEKYWSRLTESRATIARALLRELDADLQARLQTKILNQRREQFDKLMQRGKTADRTAAWDLNAAWDLYVGFNISMLTLGRRPDPSELRRTAYAIVDGMRRTPQPAQRSLNGKSKAVPEFAANIARNVDRKPAKAQSRKPPVLA